MRKIKQYIRNIAKIVVQQIVLPAAYWLANKRYKGEKELYVFADAHHTDLPFSLAYMHRYIVSKGIVPHCHFHDYTHEGAWKSLCHGISFMDLYARAKYVFICDTFLPASSCRKDARTKVIQLCHYSGPFKKIGYDTPDDIPPYYIGNVFRNYDLATASAEAYVPKLQSAMRLEEGIVQPLGVSRSDVYFDKEWNDRCRENFYHAYPHAVGKKVILWAPTFRGVAASPDALDNESMVALQDKLGEEWVVLIKHHPHDDAVAVDPRYRSNCTIPSEQLLPVVDLLITDYSTVVLDYLTYEKPFILYAPDLDAYECTRGFYVDYRAITKNLTRDAEHLDEMIRQVYRQWLDGDRADIEKCKKYFVSACDGKATERIMEYMWRTEEQRD